jgi:glucose/arabinose dehydrogenase
MTAALLRAVALTFLPLTAASCLWSSDSSDLASGFDREVFVDGLELPVAMALAPDGSIFVTEKESGDIRLIDPAGSLQPEPVIHFDVAGAGEWGLLGIALHPQYATNSLAYVYYMEPEEDGRSRPLIARFAVEDGRGSDPTIIVDDLPRTSISGGSPEADLFSNIHVGGNLHFGPDGLLYVAIGDFGVFEQRSADLSQPLGKILRFTTDGEPAPVPGLGDDALPSVFAYGLRNSFDFDFAPDGRIFAVDNGPDACDEINIIAAGANYGWPSPRLSADTCERRDGEPAIGYLAREDTEPPDNGSTVGPSSLLYLATDFGSLPGPALVVCEVNTGRLRYLPFDGDSLNPDDGAILADDCFTDVIQLPDGNLLYATTSSIKRLSIAR